ncbi:response regulator [Chryseosolibacter indicus]|uniref:Response regulator n=1 Tax=Chryseosolibacter indicus TaxID=2782351 RepID=A0ABS5VTW1_9BACT|nr:response regulator [Chryseosolibacter indicus]MBT1703426.1 response regulator [Chryseosolibacter indicus]
MAKKILVAEDNSDSLIILQNILTSAGYKVEAISAGYNIVENRLDLPDLFILDKNMPTIDGLALCKYLRLKPETNKIPIILISGNQDLEVKAKEAGANEFLSKPFSVTQLLMLISKQLNATA